MSSRRKVVFKEYAPNQGMLLPPSLEELIGKTHAVRVVNSVIDKIDIGPLVDTFKGGGTSSYHPAMLLKILVYAYLNNVYSSRRIEAAVKENIHFMWLAGMKRPDHNTINRFRGQRLKKHIKEVFTQVVLLLMEAGHVDLAIGLLPQLKTGFFQQRLFLQKYVCLFREGHELDKGAISKKEFYDADHVVVVSAGTGHAKIDELIESAGATRRVRLLVPHFVAVGHILSGTDMIATVPERYAKRCAQPFGLKYVPHPVSLPQIEINLFWHAKFHKEPGNQWLRQVIFELFSTSLR